MTGCLQAKREKLVVCSVKVQKSQNQGSQDCSPQSEAEVPRAPGRSLVKVQSPKAKESEV